MTPAARKLFFVAVTSMIIKVFLTQPASYLSRDAINRSLSTRMMTRLARPDPSTQLHRPSMDDPTEQDPVLHFTPSVHPSILNFQLHHACPVSSLPSSCLDRDRSDACSFHKCMHVRDMESNSMNDMMRCSKASKLASVGRAR
jgi:hypothetical protein